MTLEKAIKTLQFQLSKPDNVVGPGTKAAVHLGIEALKAVKDARANNYWTPIPTMPGETED